MEEERLLAGRKGMMAEKMPSASTTLLFFLKELAGALLCHLRRKKQKQSLKKQKQSLT
jgi:hypothetical protein